MHVANLPAVKAAIPPSIVFSIMNRITLLAAAALMMSAFCFQASAQSYTLGYDSTRYDVNAGDTVDVMVILTEEISGAEVSRLAAGGADGLFAFSAGVDYSMFTGGTGSTFNSLVLDPRFTGGSAGSGQDVTDDPGLVSFEGVEDFNGNDVDGEAGVTGTMVSSTIYELELATLTFDAGSLGSVTTLDLREHVSGAANPFLFGDNAVPDIAFSSAVINVIPEPGSACVVALLAGIGLIRRRRS